MINANTGRGGWFVDEKRLAPPPSLWRRCILQSGLLRLLPACVGKAKKAGWAEAQK